MDKEKVPLIYFFQWFETRFGGFISKAFLNGGKRKAE